MVEACRAVRTQVSNAERMRALAASIAAYETAIARAVRSLAIVHRHTLGVLQLADREPQLRELANKAQSLAFADSCDGWPRPELVGRCVQHGFSACSCSRGAA